MTLVLLFIAITWLNKISTLPKYFFTNFKILNQYLLHFISSILIQSIEEKFETKFLC